MARLRRRSPSGDESSDGSDFCQIERGAVEEMTAQETTAKLRSSPRKTAAKSYCDVECASSEESEYTTRPVPKAKPNTQSRGRQIRLAPLNARFLAKPLPNDILPARNLYRSKVPNDTKAPKDAVLMPQESIEPVSAVNKAYSSDSSAEIEVEESIWCGSDGTLDDSDEELPSPRKFLRLPRKVSDLEPRPEASDLSYRLNALALTGKGEPLSSTDKTKKLGSFTLASSRPASSSDKEDNAAFLRYSPPRLYNPSKHMPQDRPRLQSPSKTKSRLPTPPLQQSPDAFWNSNTINDWNDQYSPQKVLKSPKKLKFLKDDALVSPTASPRKYQSPSKSTRAEREAKKDFASRKRGIAEDFLAELDNVVTNGKINELAAPTGGVRFVWSKTLNSTAGRANWRKEITRTRKPDGTIEGTHKHHASIELAEKVINDEHRLINVIAHEFCHLANFMISGIKDQPHGCQFKEWGRKCTQAFKHRGVEVTTKHSYQIEYKYIWQCGNEDCGVEFKRHSKSIDPKRHTCGTCRSKLIQIKPAPRKDAGNGTGYAAYVKAHFAEVKRSMPRASQKEVMEAVGRKYRAEKAANNEALVAKDASSGKESSNDVNTLVNGLEVITLDDD